MNGLTGGGALGGVTSRLGKARRSFVRRITSWPRGTRQKGSWLGFSHNEIWFPISRQEFARHMREKDARVAMLNDVVPPGEHRLGCRDRRQWFWRLYLERRMIYLFGFSLRYHVFHTGDDDSALHDHPWWFVTFPLDTYDEQTRGGLDSRPVQEVRRLRLHFRPVSHRHAVCWPEPGRKIRTIVLTGRIRRTWGFWPDGRFVPFPEWTSYE